MLRYAVLITMALLCAVPAHASPTDPDGEDWVSMAVSPTSGQAGYGAAGNREQAIQIASDECSSRGSKCVTADTTEYGCVAFEWDPHSKSWAGGRGADKDSAMQDASNKMDVNFTDDTKGAAWCSTPISPP